MLTTVFFAMGLFALATLGLAAGLMLQGRPLQGSCGGLNNTEGSCALCGADRQEICQRP